MKPLLKIKQECEELRAAMHRRYGDNYPPSGDADGWKLYGRYSEACYLLEVLDDE